jgi:hypothetical protein
MTTTRDLTDKDIAIIKARALRGDKYSEIASDYRLNQGRVADIKFGRIRSEIQPADLSGMLI